MADSPESLKTSTIGAIAIVVVAIVANAVARIIGGFLNVALIIRAVIAVIVWAVVSNGVRVAAVPLAPAIAAQAAEILAELVEPIGRDAATPVRLFAHVLLAGLLLRLAMRPSARCVWALVVYQAAGVVFNAVQLLDPTVWMLRNAVVGFGTASSLICELTGRAVSIGLLIVGLREHQRIVAALQGDDTSRLASPLTS